ncbi:MAG: photosystem I reaction center subunit PsaK [Prochlorotrichaceae cyanobacterium]|jgi:photosystem I subunit 10
MISTLLIHNFLATVPVTPTWSLKIGAIMILCNILAIAFAKATVKIQNAGPAMPSPEMFGGFGLPAVIGSTCFGHILGAGVILGLTYMGSI